MLRIDVTTLIHRPVREVWDFFTDFANSSRWTRSGSELRQTSTGPLGVGSTVESVGHLFGREITSQTLQATHYEPDRLIAFTGSVPLLGSLVGGFTFETVGEATRLSRWMQVDQGWASGALGSLFAPIVRRAQRTELANLKRLIEARG